MQHVQRWPVSYLHVAKQSACICSVGRFAVHWLAMHLALALHSRLHTLSKNACLSK